MRVTNSILYRDSLSNVSDQRARLARLQEQASTGLKLNRPSDDPTAARAATLLRAGIEAISQYQENLNRTRARINAVEGALADTFDVLSRTRELSVQAANGTLDADSRRIIAVEVESLHDRLLSLSNTQSSGAHVFAGYASASAPFVASGPFVDGLPSPTVSFVGDTTEIEVDVDEGVQVQVTLNGERVFLGDGDGNGAPDPGLEDLFDLLADLRDALVANDQVAVAGTLDRLDRAQAQINQERTRIGSSDAKAALFEDRLARRKLTLESNLSNVQDADSVEVFSELVRQEATLQASLETAARVLQPTLLDFL
ncbi:MAG: flagellar hook-associated protein FlgL [Proteobacteria bacterium]|nr:flagellar hook-associated protein FlgL [Pseudomonadota bacterium]